VVGSEKKEEKCRVVLGRAHRRCKMKIQAKAFTFFIFDCLMPDQTTVLTLWDAKLRARIQELSLLACTTDVQQGFWVSLSDASVDPRGAKSGVAAVVLNPEGAWMGEAQKRGAELTRDTRLAEIWGIELGAKLALEKGAKGAFLALCDCQPAVDALTWAQRARKQAASAIDGVDGAGAPSGLAKDAALKAAAALDAVGEWRVSWVPREKLSRANDLARQALGLRPENKTAVGWSDKSWRPRAQAMDHQAPSPVGNESEAATQAQALRSLLDGPASSCKKDSSTMARQPSAHTGKP